MAVGRIVGVAVCSKGKGTVGDGGIAALGREPNLSPIRNAPTPAIMTIAAMAAMPITIRVCLLNYGSSLTSTQKRLVLFQAGMIPSYSVLI